MNKRNVLNVCKYLLAVGLLVFVVHKNWAPEGSRGLQYVWQRYAVEGQPIHGGFLLGAVVFFTTSVLLTQVRWYFLVRALDLPFRMADALRFGLIGFFFNSFLPGSVGGDIVKAAAVAREQNRRTAAVATVLMDRALGLWGLFWFVALLGSAFWIGGLLEGPGAEQSHLVVKWFLGIVAFTGAIWLLLGLLPQHRAERFAGRLTRIPRVGNAVAELWRAVWMYRCRQRSVLLALALSFVNFTGLVLSFYCCVRIVWDGAPDNAIPTLAQHFLIVPIGLIIMSLPGSPGGAGIAELGFGALYKWFGCLASNGVLGTLLQRILTWTLGFAGYAAVARARKQAPAVLIPVRGTDEEAPAEIVTAKASA